MLNITRYLADQTFEAKMDGETHKFKIVPEFSSKLRANLYFGKDEQNSRGGITTSSNDGTASHYKQAQIDESQTQPAEISLAPSLINVSVSSKKHASVSSETNFKMLCVSERLSGRYKFLRTINNAPLYQVRPFIIKMLQ